MTVLQLPTTADILLLYPGESLRDQIGVWARRHPERQVDSSLERSLPAIRGLLRRAGSSLVDATEDPGQATDAFLQAVARLGAGAVTMYTEATHEDLELFVRLRGSLYLFGPLFDEQWEEVFNHLLRAKWPAPVSRGQLPRLPLPTPLLERQRRQRERFLNRFRASFDLPASDFL